MKIISRCLVAVLVFLNMTNVLAQSFHLTEVDDELCRIGGEDQRIRIKLIEVMQKKPSDLMTIKPEMDSIDSRNQIYVADLLDKHGWPDNFSESANKAIFLVIDHASKSFSEKYFPFVKEKADKGVISKSDVATLEDRILMKSMQKQKYGTQTISKKNNEGEDVTYVWPVEDAEKVDELRNAVGLTPISLYIQLLENQFKRKVVWDKNMSVSDFNVTF